MAELLVLALRFAYYLGVAFGVLLAVVLMPGWWWALMAAVLVLCIALGIAKGMGKPWANRTSKALFWPRG